MSFNERYKDRLDRYEQFWERTNKTPVLNFTAPKEGATPFTKPTDLKQKWLDAAATALFTYPAFIIQAARAADSTKVE